VPKTIDHAYERFMSATTKASDVGRALGLSAVAIVWLLAAGVSASDPNVVLKAIGGSGLLSWAIRLAVLGLLADGLQYLWAAGSWGLYAWVGKRVWRARSLPWGSEAKAYWWLSTVFWLDRTVLRASLSEADYREQLKRSRSDRKAEAAARLRDGEPKSLLTESVSPPFLNGVSYLLFWFKMTAIIGAYATLLSYVLNVLGKP
jgi:hypothetical protein